MWTRQTLFFNHFIKGMAEQEEAEQGVGGGQVGDDLQVEIFASWRVNFDP